MDINNPPLYAIQELKACGLESSNWIKIWKDICLREIRLARGDIKTQFNDGGIPFTPERLMEVFQRELYIKRDHNILVMCTLLNGLFG